MNTEEAVKMAIQITHAFKNEGYFEPEKDAKPDLKYSVHPEDGCIIQIIAETTEGAEYIVEVGGLYYFIWDACHNPDEFDNAVDYLAAEQEIVTWSPRGTVWEMAAQLYNAYYGE